MPRSMAHELLDRGLHVFPVDHPNHPRCIGLHGPSNPCDGSRGKHPAVKWGVWAHTVTAKMIDLGWGKHRGLANPAVSCGPSNLVVLDEDGPDEIDRWCATYGIDLPATYTVTTGRGRHLYFRWDHAEHRIGNSSKALDGYKIDVRGHGGYVVAEGAQHASGALYEGNGHPIADLPQQVANMLLAGASNEGEGGGEPVLETVTSSPDATRIPYSKRHDALVAYAGRLRKSGLDHQEAVPVFRQRWLLCEQPEGQIPEARFHSAACPYPVTWEEAEGKLSDVFDRYPPGRKLAQDEPPDEVAVDMPKLWKATDLRPAAQPRWLAKGRLPRDAVSLLIGDEGIGKSLFWCWIVAAITAGNPLPEFGIPARSAATVILVCTEDDWSSTVRPRLEVAGADLDKVQVICTEDDGSGSPVFPRDCFLILEADPKPALVIVDAWLDTVSAGMSVRDPQQARQALHPWKEIATATGAAVLLLTHTNRVASPNARDRYGASYALRQKARLTLYAQQDDEGYLLIGPEKANNTAEVPASRFTITSEHYFLPSDEHDGTVPLLAYIGESDRTAREHVAAIADPNIEEFDEHDYTADLQASWLYKLLDDARRGEASVRPKDAVAVAADKGISRRSVFRLFDALANAGMARSVDGTAFPRVTHWQLIDGTTGAMSTEPGTTGTTGDDLHKQGGTTGVLWDEGGITGETGSDQAKGAEELPVVPPRCGNTPPGGISSRTIGMTPRVLAALAKAAGQQ